MSRGEELRDVIIWLWVLSYSDSAGTSVAFISDDSGFWTKDEGVHPDIERDLISKDGRVSIYRSIDDFAKQHAPAPKAATQEWALEHVSIPSIEPEILQKATADLGNRLRGGVRDLRLEGSEFIEVACFRFLRIPNLLNLNSDWCFALTICGTHRRQPPVLEVWEVRGPSQSSLPGLAPP
jgi:hypothetical protein